VSGPSYCAKCGAWPGLYGPHHNLCVRCDDIRHCASNPVPLPNNVEMLKDLCRLYQTALAGESESAIDSTPATEKGQKQ